METTLESWSKFISVLRDNYTSLNYFTINQIQFLSSNIPGILNDTILPKNLDLIFSMLYDLSSNLTKEKLKSLLSASFNTNKNVANDQSILEKEMSDIEIAWARFIKQQDSTNKNLNSRLTLKSLAIFLEALSPQKQDSIRKRNIPGYLNQNKGISSLVQCQPHEQIPITLSMYAYDPRAPMPSNDELLYCDSTISYECIEIFLRRAFASDSSKIFTVLNVQELNYETANILEKRYPTLSSSKRTNEFILVFICCNGQNDSIVSSMFLRNMITPIVLNNSDLKEYLSSNLLAESSAFVKYEK